MAAAFRVRTYWCKPEKRERSIWWIGTQWADIARAAAEIPTLFKSCPQPSAAFGVHQHFGTTTFTTAARETRCGHFRFHAIQAEIQHSAGQLQEAQFQSANMAQRLRS